MALQRLDLDTLRNNTSSRVINPQIMEVLEINKDVICILYKEKRTVAAIVNQLNDGYKGQLEKVTVRYPDRINGAMKTTITEPKVTIKQVKDILVKNGLMTVEEARSKSRKNEIGVI